MTPQEIAQAAIKDKKKSSDKETIESVRVESREELQKQPIRVRAKHVYVFGGIMLIVIIGGITYYFFMKTLMQKRMIENTVSSVLNSAGRLGLGVGYAVNSMAANREAAIEVLSESIKQAFKVEV